MKISLKDNLYLLLFVGIFVFAVWIRWGSSNFTTILDYDPWWFFRHAQEILNNHFILPKWDLLSYFPPGRPNTDYMGWSYTMAIFYVIVHPFSSITFMRFAGLFIAFFSAACAIPAFFVGRYVTNKWGGLVTGFFGTITPIFITRSIAGYPAADAADVFWSFVVVFTTLYAIKTFKGFRDKKSWMSIIIAVLSYWVFAMNFNNAWYIYYIFLAFIPFILAMRLFETYLYKKVGNFSQKLTTVWNENKNIVYAIILIGILGEVICRITIGYPFNTVSPISNLLGGALFLQQYLIVNQSIAELQVLNVFSVAGFSSLVANIGLVPMILVLGGFPLLLIYKWWKKIEIHNAEYYSIIWLIATFWIITHGIRLSLLFGIGVAAGAGFVVGNLVEIMKGYKNILLISIVYGLLIFGIVYAINVNLPLASNSAGSFDIGQNWRDALDWLKEYADPNSIITTWWDPGHIITGYTGLRVMADGSHCPNTSCQPYDINVRIQDMGRAFVTSDENESVRILQKYMGLTAQQCADVKATFGSSVVPPEACQSASGMYLIASSDLIQKYYWLSYFGTSTGHQIYTLPLSNVERDSNGTATAFDYANGQFILAIKDNRLVPIINNKIIEHIIYYNNNQPVQDSFTNSTAATPGLVIVNPNFQSLVLMDGDTMNSVFVRMFFANGQGLQHYNLVYQNSEIKIFKVVF